MAASRATTSRLTESAMSTSARADVDIALSVIREVVAREAAIRLPRLVPYGDVWRDISIGEPLQEVPCAVDRVGREPLWAQSIASDDAGDHRLGDGDLRAPVGARALGIDDDAQPVADQIGGIIGEERAHCLPGCASGLWIGQRDLFRWLAIATAVTTITAVFRGTRLVERREILPDRARCLFRPGPLDGPLSRHAPRLIDVRPDQAGVDRERLAANQAGCDAGGHHALEHVPQHLALAEALVPGAGEHGVVGNRVFDAETTQPAIRQIDPNLRTDPPLRPDRKHIADQQHPDHQFWIDRGASAFAVERRKLLVDPAKIEHCIDPSHQMIGWNHIIEMEFVEQLPLTPGQPTHHRSPPALIVSAAPNHASRPASMRFCNTINPEADAIGPLLDVRDVPEGDILISVKMSERRCG